MRSRRTVLGLLLLAVCASPVPAAILRVPQGYPSIQAGLAAAHAGDVVLVAPGRYFESLTMLPGVHIHGEPGAILDGGLTVGPLVRAQPGVDHTAVLSGFVIRRSPRAGIFLNQAAPTIRNNVITAHTGPGIDCFQAAPLILNNIITANAGGGIVCRHPDSAPTIAYNDLWENQPADAFGCTLGVGNRNQNPRFVDAVQGNYRLRTDSPLIDAGNPDVALNDADGSRNDMGAQGGPQPRPAPSPWQIFAPPEVLPSSLATHGLPGIINVPTATMVPLGTVDLGYHNRRDPHVFPGVESQKTFNFALGFLPWLTIGARGTVASAAGRDLAHDVSANLQLLLLPEGLWWPSLALGFLDLGGGSRLLESNYLVLSKSVLERVRLSAGFGTGPAQLDGPFGGVEVALTRHITLLGEYDTRDINAGVRLSPPLPSVFETYGVPRPTIDLLWQNGKDFAWGVSLRHTLGAAQWQASRVALADKRYSRWTPAPDTEVSLQAVSEQLQAELIERGLENVRVSVLRLRDVASVVVVVEYENRRYNRDELDGLGLVLGLTATRTPPLVTHLSVIVKKANIPVLQFSAAVDDYLAFLNERMSAKTFAQQVHMTQQAQGPMGSATVEATTPISNRSWLKLDVFVRPRIDTTLLTDRDVAELRFSLVPDAYMQLTPGTVGNVRAALPVTRTAGFPGVLGDPEVDRLLLHQAIRLPLGMLPHWATGLTQLSLGLFTSADVGIGNETALTLFDGVGFVKGTVAWVGSSYAALDRWVALANGRVRYPPWDLTLSVTAGRFLDGDQGVATELSRFFGTTEIGVFLRHSDHGSLAGLRLAVPLTLAKELPPWRVRPRLPDLFTYEQNSTVFTDRNVRRNDIGRALTTDHEIEQVYWNRDRLYPAYIRQHLDTLKQAARRWVEE